MSAEQKTTGAVRDLGYQAVSPDDKQASQRQGMGTIPLVAVVACIAAACTLTACMLTQWLTNGTQEPGVTIDDVQIDVTKQNGLTANVHAGVKFDNDMSRTLYNNNNAYSKDGDVRRINGAYDNNAESKDGHVVRANGAMDNNAMNKGSGDLLRQNGLYLNSPGGLGTSLVKHAVGGGLGLLGADEIPPPDDLSDEDKELVDKLIQIIKKAHGGSSHNVTQARDTLATFYGMKAAQSEEKKAHIMKVLNLLYGPLDANETGGLDDNSNVEAKILDKLEKRWIKNELQAMKDQRQTIDEAVQLLTNNSDNQVVTSSQDTQRLTLNETHEELKADLASLAESLEGLPQGRPVHIGKLHIKVKEQNGLQANLGAGAIFSNKMPDSLHDNNAAHSDTGTVWRFNGAFDNNARSSEGNVLRVNGAYDNNAVSRNGTVQRQNGVMMG